MENKRKSYFIIILQSGLLWSALPVMWSYMPAYLDMNGFTAGQVGLLMAVNPIIAMIFQPLLGIQADRTRSKNRMFALLMAGAIMSVFFLPYNRTFILTLIIIMIMSLFQVSLIPISESITLEALEHIHKSYAPSRMAGTICYSASALLLGYLMDIKVHYLFYAVMLIGLVHIGVMFMMPTVSGHQSSENKIRFRALFEDHFLILFYVFSLVAALLMSFFYTFFPIYFLDLGGSSDRLGILFLIGAMSEVPFLLFADRILKRFGNHLILLISMFFIGFRILLLTFVTDPLQIYPIAALNGLAFIVFNYVIAVYINKTVKKELRTTGQTVLALSMGAGRIIGTMLGGILIDSIGLTLTNILSFILSLVAILAFVITISIIKKPKLRLQ